MSWPRPEQVNPDRYTDRLFSLTPSSDRTDLIPDPPDPDADHRPWTVALMIVGWLLAAVLTLSTRGSRSFQEGPSTPYENRRITVNLMESTTMAGLVLTIIGTALALALVPVEDRRGHRQRRARRDRPGGLAQRLERHIGAVVPQW